MSLLSFPLAAGLIFCGAAPLASTATQSKPPEIWPGAELFARGAVWRIEITAPPAAIDSLRKDPREFIRATILENGKVYENVAVHLKGSVGSFQEVDEKPDLTLDFNRFNAGQKFHGLRRIHLNNSVEDPSYCNELLGGELFRAAGIPAPRVTHAVVTLNGRRLGLYVLKEGFTEDFLGCHFTQVGGDLYEPAEGHDVNQKLKRNSILAPKQNQAGLAALAAAALEPDAARRWTRLEQTLDTGNFVDFMAMEVMLGHRDGYCLARNNYRVYYDLDAGKMMFFPHGMDQLFGNSNATWLPHMTGLVAKAVMETIEGRQRYRASFATLFTNVFRATPLQQRVDEVVAGLRPALTEAEFAGVHDEADIVKKRIAQRQSSLEQQLREPEPVLLAFANGSARLGGWTKMDESPSVRMEQGVAIDHTTALHIAARSESGASWRTEVLLPRGRYRFEGAVKAVGVKPLPFGKSQGAGLRVAGTTRGSANIIVDSTWRSLSTDFDVTDETQVVEVMCELRASEGEAWFRLDSLKLIQIR